MRHFILAACVVGIVVAGSATAADQPKDQPLLREVAGDVSADALRDMIAKLVSFGTRHTASETQSDTRGIGAARRWVKAQFGAINDKCRCLEIETPSQLVTAERLPK